MTNVRYGIISCLDWTGSISRFGVASSSFTDLDYVIEFTLVTPLPLFVNICSKPYSFSFEIPGSNVDLVMLLESKPELDSI